MAQENSPLRPWVTLFSIFYFISCPPSDHTYSLTSRHDHTFARNFLNHPIDFLTGLFTPSSHSDSWSWAIWNLPWLISQLSWLVFRIDCESSELTSIYQTFLCIHSICCVIPQFRANRQIFCVSFQYFVSLLNSLRSDSMFSVIVQSVSFCGSFRTWVIDAEIPCVILYSIQWWWCWMAFTSPSVVFISIDTLVLSYLRNFIRFAEQLSIHRENDLMVITHCFCESFIDWFLWEWWMFDWPSSNSYFVVRECQFLDSRFISCSVFDFLSLFWFFIRSSLSFEYTRCWSTQEGRAIEWNSLVRIDKMKCYICVSLIGDDCLVGISLWVLSTWNCI
jgi:hypothetical protein